MTTRAYYNEFDPKAAAVLRELIAANQIAPGDVDERSIMDVTPDDLAGYTQCHFFAGIGIWSLALRRAGWSDSRRVWTGSCPCQPFSAAGKGFAFDDERHLWPAWFHLISEVDIPPESIFGEQVASKDGLTWFDLVQSDLEGTGYAVRVADLCAAGFGAPHIRQRLVFRADRIQHTTSDGRILASGRGLGGLADGDDAGLEGRGQSGRECAAERLVGQNSLVGGVALAHDTERRADATGGHDSLGPHAGRTQGAGDVEGRGGDGRPGPVNGFWRGADWLFCRDGKWRPVEPGTFPLDYGYPSRVDFLRTYGNAIVPQKIQAFIEATEEEDK